VSQITGTSNIGGINQPVIGTKKIEHDIRLKNGEVSVLGGLIERTDTKNINGIPGLADIPLARYLFSQEDKEIEEDEVLIVLTPQIIRFPSITADNLRTIAAGTDTNARVYREGADALPVPAAPAVPSAAPARPAPAPGPAPQANGGNAGASVTQLHFDPATASLKRGDTTTLGLAISNVSDLYSIPLLIHYDPAVIQVEDVRNGGFLGGGGTQEIAIVQRVDQQRGEVVISATRPPKTAGVNGSGTLLGIVVRAVGPGSTTLQILQVNARDSQQRNIAIVSGFATIQVQ
jgi:general secretion pathway protein D